MGSIKHLVEQNRSDDSKHTLSNFACPLLVHFSLLQPNDCTLRDHSQLAFVASITPTSRKYDLTSTSTDSTGCSMWMVNAREWALLLLDGIPPTVLLREYLPGLLGVNVAPLAKPRSKLCSTLDRGLLLITPDDFTSTGSALLPPRFGETILLS